MQANELVINYINFAKLQHHKYIKSKPSLVFVYDDLLSCAYIGLIIAAKKYDRNKGVKFSTFANKFIKGQMISFLRDQGFIKRKTFEKINLFKKAKEESLKKFDRVDVKYIRKISNLSMKDINFAMQCEENSIALDDPKCNIDLLCKYKNPEEAYMETQNKEMLFKLAEQLPQRTKEIFRMICDDITMKDIGKKFGISESRVSQIYKEAELKIIELSKKSKLKQNHQSYLPPSQDQPKKPSIAASQTNLIPATCKDCGNSFQVKKTDRIKSVCKKCFGKRISNGRKENKIAKTSKSPSSNISRQIAKKNLNGILSIVFDESQRDKKLFDDLERIAKKERRTLCNQILHILDKYVHDRQFA